MLLTQILHLPQPHPSIKVVSIPDWELVTGLAHQVCMGDLEDMEVEATVLVCTEAEADTVEACTVGVCTVEAWEWAWVLPFFLYGRSLWYDGQNGLGWE